MGIYVIETLVNSYEKIKIFERNSEQSLADDSINNLK